MSEIIPIRKEIKIMKNDLLEKEATFYSIYAHIDERYQDKSGLEILKKISRALANLDHISLEDVLNKCRQKSFSNTQNCFLKDSLEKFTSISEFFYLINERISLTSLFYILQSYPEIGIKLHLIMMAWNQALQRDLIEKSGK